MVPALLTPPRVTARSESASRPERALSRYPGIYATTAIAVTAPLLLGLAGWPPSARGLEVVGLMLAAIAGALLDRRRSTTKPSAIAFVVDFAALLLGGRAMAAIVASLGVVLRSMAGSSRRRVFADVAVVVASIQSAGFVHARLGGTVGHFEWPWQGVPIATAAVVYCLVQYVLKECVVPFVARRPVNLSWPRLVARDVPDFILAAVVSVVVVAAIEHRMWGLLFAAVMPLVFVYRAHFRHLDRLEREQRHHDVDRVPRSGHMRPRSERPDHCLERGASAHRQLSARARARPDARCRVARALQDRVPASVRRGPELPAPANALALAVASVRGCSDSAGQDPPGSRTASRCCGTTSPIGRAQNRRCSEARSASR